MNRTIRRTMCILLALVLMSSSAVSYTFAEYARGSEMSDNSRASIWGVNVDLTGSAFATKYTSSKTYDGIDTSVKSSTYGQADAEKILAPGTSGTFSGISCTGTPEVSVRIEIDANLQLNNWIADGKYYCPLIITVGDRDYNGLDYPSSAAFEEAIESAIESAVGTYGPNTDLSTVTGLNGNYNWYWPFDRTDYGDLNPYSSSLTVEQKAQIAALRAPNDAQDSALIGKASIALSVSCSVYQVGDDMPDPDPTPTPDPDPDDGLTDDGELDVSDKGPIIWF